MKLARFSVLALSALTLSLVACGAYDDEDGDPNAAAANEGMGETTSELKTGTTVVLQAPKGQFVRLGVLGGLRAEGRYQNEGTTFSVTDRGGGKIALRAPNGKYVTCSNGGGGGVSATATSLGANETFTVTGRGDGRSALGCADGKHWIRAEDGGGREMNAAAVEMGSWTPIGVVLTARTSPNRAIGIGGVRWPTGPGEMGAKVIRGDFSWASHQAKEGGPLSFVKDKYVEEANVQGVKVLAVIGYAPAWARLDSCQRDAKLAEDKRTKCEPRNPEEYGEWAGKMAEHYSKLGVHHWEIWNEANSKHFWEPKPNPSLYAQMLVSAYKKIKAADPNATVLAGGTASLGEYNPAGVPDENMIDPRNFLEAIYEHGGGDSFDAFSHHPYTWSNPNTPIAKHDNWTMMYEDKPNMPSLMTIMSEHKDAAKKIWITEYGVPTSKLKSGELLTEQHQSDVMKSTFETWEMYPWAGNFYWFNYEDFDSKASPNQHNFHLGLTRSTDGVPGCNARNQPTGTAKLAYCTFRKMMGR